MGLMLPYISIVHDPWLIYGNPNHLMGVIHAHDVMAIAQDQEMITMYM